MRGILRPVRRRRLWQRSRHGTEKFRRIGLEVDDNRARVAADEDLFEKGSKSERRLAGPAVAEKVRVLSEHVSWHEQGAAIVSEAAHVKAVAFNRIDGRLDVSDQMGPVFEGNLVASVAVGLSQDGQSEGQGHSERESERKRQGENHTSDPDDGSIQPG